MASSHNGADDEQNAAGSSGHAALGDVRAVPHGGSTPEPLASPRRSFLKQAMAAAGASAAAAATGTAAQAADAPAAATPGSASANTATAAAKAPEGLIERPGSDFMIDVIRTLDIDYITTNPGSSFRSLHESLVNYGGNTKPELLTCLHEESAVAMAHGYAKAAGKLNAAWTPSSSSPKPWARPWWTWAGA